MTHRPIHPILLTPCLAAAALLAACGGDGSTNPFGGGTGTLRLSLTDAPACGFDHAFVTVEKVRVHRSSTAADGDGGWEEIVLPTPLRVDLLSLTNGTLAPLGQKALPAGTYTQLRLVLAPNTPAAPLANAVKPTGGSEVPLTTPSAAQSGLKLDVRLEVPVDRIADFAIDFDACKSFVRAGNSGQVLLKPVLSVLPILSDAGQRIEGWLDASLVAPGTTVSVQNAGAPVRATPPGADGRFVLYPVPAGSYELVITAAGRVNAVITGVPVTTTAFTTLGSTSVRLNTPLSVNASTVSGTVTVNGSGVDTGGVVRARQTFSGGPTVEVASTNALANDGSWSLGLPLEAPVRLAYAANATSFVFSPDATAAARFTLAATASGFATAKTSELTLPVAAPVAFSFP